MSGTCYDVICAMNLHVVNNPSITEYCKQSKMEARKAYKQDYRLVLERLVKLLTCAIVKTSQYKEETPPVAKLNNEMST